MKSYKEVISFEGNIGKDKFISKVIQKNKSYVLLVTDEYLGIKERKVTESLSIEKILLHFNKVNQIYINKSKK